MHLDFYVYVSKKASDGSVFYVGKGRGRRAWTQKRNTFWRNVANKHGVVTEIVKSDMSESDAFAYEKELIAQLGRANLCNFTDGGDGSSGYRWSEEGRRKISENLTGRFCSQATREKLSSSLRGKVRTPSQIAKHAAAIRGRALSQEHRDTLRRALIGHQVSEETRRKLSESNRGQTRSADTRRRLSEAHVGKTPTGETRRKMSESRKNKSVSEKDEIYGKLRKPVICSNGLRFDSLAAATAWVVAQFGRGEKSAIGKCASGKLKSAYGMVWEYEKCKS